MTSDRTTSDIDFTTGAEYSLRVKDCQPKSITFALGDGVLWVEGGVLQFTGDVSESAQLFVDCVNNLLGKETPVA